MGEVLKKKQSLFSKKEDKNPDLLSLRSEKTEKVGNANTEHVLLDL